MFVLFVCLLNGGPSKSEQSYFLLTAQSLSGARVFELGFMVRDKNMFDYGHVFVCSGSTSCARESVRCTVNVSSTRDH